MHREKRNCGKLGRRDNLRSRVLIQSGKKKKSVISDKACAADHANWS